jgi:hypothetical protein
MRRCEGVVALVLLLTVTAACAPGSSTPPEVGSPASVATAGPETLAPATPEAPSQPAPSAEQSAFGLDDWSHTQLFLLAGLEPKFRATCAPGSVLPKGSSDGIDCKPEGIEALRVYAFDDRADMQRLYFTRLGENSVKADTRDGCQDGRPGEIADSPDFGWGPNRIGCYLDESGDANVRMIFPTRNYGQSVYIGVVGRNGNIDDLMRWLFPNFVAGAIDCTWCIDSLWSMPGE